MATKSSNHLSIYLKMTFQSNVSISAKMHINNSYKFKIIHIWSANAMKKVILGSKFMLPWQPNSNGQLPYINSILEVCYLSSAKVSMSTIFKVKITDIYIPHIGDKKLCNVRDVCYHGYTNITVLNLPKSILFKANFQIKENRHAY